MKTLIITLLCLLSCATLHAQSEAEALDFVKAHHPAIHDKIVALKTTAPDDYQSALDDAEKAAADYARIEASGDKPAMEAFIKMYAIDFAAVTLSDKYLRATNDKDRADLKAQLRVKIAESFDCWVIVERARVKRLEAELAKAKVAIENAVTNREKVITDDTEALINESADYQKTKNQ